MLSEVYTQLKQESLFAPVSGKAPRTPRTPSPKARSATNVHKESTPQLSPRVRGSERPADEGATAPIPALPDWPKELASSSSGLEQSAGLTMPFMQTAMPAARRKNRSCFVKKRLKVTDESFTESVEVYEFDPHECSKVANATIEPIKSEADARPKLADKVVYPGGRRAANTFSPVTWRHYVEAIAKAQLLKTSLDVTRKAESDRGPQPDDVRWPMIVYKNGQAEQWDERSVKQIRTKDRRRRM